MYTYIKWCINFARSKILIEKTEGGRTKRMSEGNRITYGVSQIAVLVNNEATHRYWIGSLIQGSTMRKHSASLSHKVKGK